jgi:hypothetical protein
LTCIIFTVAENVATTPQPCLRDEITLSPSVPGGEDAASSGIAFNNDPGGSPAYTI